MTVATVFDSRRPRPNVLAEAMRAANFTADLARVIVAAEGADHLEPARFFANTYPTGSLKNLFPNVCGRLRGAGDEVARKFGLDTPHGGGRPHGLITLCHATRNRLDAPGTEELVDRACLPRGRARISPFDSENADPAVGRQMESGHLAHTPWAEIASALGGDDE